MEEKVQPAKSSQLPTQKKIYSPPALVVYGKVKDLTAGGSTGKGEHQNPHGKWVGPGGHS